VIRREVGEVIITLAAEILEDEEGMHDDAMQRGGESGLFSFVFAR
jgi:hypothetical protein